MLGNVIELKFAFTRIDIKPLINTIYNIVNILLRAYINFIVTYSKIR